MKQYPLEPSYKIPGGVEFIFRPTLGTTELNKYFFADGSSQEGIEIGMRIFINGKAMDIMYDDANGDKIVSIVYTEGRAFEISINGEVYAAGVGDVVIHSLMKSETGAERMGDAVVLSEANA